MRFIFLWLFLYAAFYNIVYGPVRTDAVKKALLS